MAIKPDPKRTHVRAVKVDAAAVEQALNPPDGEVGGLSAGVCWEAPGGELGFACPGCGRAGAIRVGNPKPDETPSWLVKAGSVAEPGKLTLEPSINCKGCCGWHGYLIGGVFVCP